MPQIGHIDIPETLWRKLIEHSARQFTDMVLEYAERETEVDITEARQQLDAALPMNIDVLKSCLISLIRIQTDDFISSDENIQDRADYQAIWQAAYSTADQICYDTTTSHPHLKGIVDKNLQDILNVPPPL